MEDTETSASGAAALALAEQVGARVDDEMRAELQAVTVRQLAGLYDAFKAPSPAGEEGSDLSPTARLRRVLCEEQALSSTSPGSPAARRGKPRSASPDIADLRRILEESRNTDYAAQLATVRDRIDEFDAEIDASAEARAGFRASRTPDREALRQARILHTGKAADEGADASAAGGALLTGNEGCAWDWCPVPAPSHTVALYRSLPTASLAVLRHLFLRAVWESDWDNDELEVALEWWRERHIVRDYERNKLHGMHWQAVMAGAADTSGGNPILAAEGERDSRLQYFESMAWWQRERYRREWLLTADAEWWRGKAVYDDYKRNGEEWLRDAPDDAAKAVREEWYSTHVPVVKTWAAAVEGASEEAEAEELAERHDYFWCGSWWTAAARQEEFALLGTDAAALSQFHEDTVPSEPLEEWQSLLTLNLYFAELAQDPALAGNKRHLRCFAGLAAAFPDTYCDIIALRSSYYETYWWRQESIVASYRSNGHDWKRVEWRGPLMADNATVQQRVEWYESLSKEWWQQPCYVDAYFQAKHVVAEPLFVYSQRSSEGAPEGPQAPSPQASPRQVGVAERQRRTLWFEANWWRQRKYVRSYHTSDGSHSLWRAARNVPWDHGAPWWTHEAFAGDYYRHPDGGRWSAMTQGAAATAHGYRTYPCSTRDRALRAQYYSSVYPLNGDDETGDASPVPPQVPPAPPAPWWQRPRFVEDFFLHGDAGGPWCARTLAAAYQKFGWRGDPCPPEEVQERRAFYLRTAGEGAAPPAPPPRVAGPAARRALSMAPEAHPIRQPELTDAAVAAAFEARSRADEGRGVPEAAEVDVLTARAEWCAQQLREEEAVRRVDWYLEQAAQAPRITLQELPAFLTAVNEGTPPTASELLDVVGYLKARGRSCVANMSHMELFEAVVGTGFFVPYTRDELELQYQEEWERQEMDELRRREEEAGFQLAPVDASEDDLSDDTSSASAAE